MSEGRVLDYTAEACRWGHNIVGRTPKDKDSGKAYSGLIVSECGLRVGDILLWGGAELGRTARYLVTKAEPQHDPHDLFSFEVEFVRRDDATVDADHRMLNTKHGTRYPTLGPVTEQANSPALKPLRPGSLGGD